MNYLESYSIHNPMLHYRLDPGEPGLLSKARASASQAAVTGQEQRNLRRLKAEAIREGRIPTHWNISYSRGIEGSFAVIRAGQTTVVSRAREEANAPAEDAAPQEAPNTDLPKTPSQPYSTDNVVKNLENKQLKLASLIRTEQSRLQNSPTPEIAQSRHRSIRRYQSELASVEKELAKLKAEDGTATETKPAALQALLRSDVAPSMVSVLIPPASSIPQNTGPNTLDMTA